MSASRVFTIPAGVPFLDALAGGVLDETDGEPFALADTLILLPTRRGARDLAEAFLRVSQGRALALPRIVPLGDVDEDLSAMDAPAAPLHADEDIPPAIAGTRRRILLAAMVQRFARDPALRAADQAIRLAGALAAFIDRAHAERVSLDRLGSLVPERFAAHWQETLAFLTIATAHWPAVLAAEGVVDPADRRNRVLERLAQRWSESPPNRRIIAAGSTGSIPATADVLRAVSRLPRGAVVLPGLDRDADEASWVELAGDPHHPQHGLARLLAHMGLSRDEVEDWPHLSDPPPSPGRARLVSEAMRPAATSESWRDLQAVLSRDAAEGVARVDCPSPAEESQVIALALRHALETPGRTAALVTPDRSLARRVAAELGRWQIEIDDSAGVPLGSTPPGAFLRLVAEMVEESFSPVPLLAALKHPLASGGIATAAFRARARDLERAVLRGPRPAAGLAGLRRALGGARLSEGERAALSGFVDVIEGATKDFAAALARADDDLASALRAHVRMAEALAASEDEAGAARLWAGEAGEAAARAIADLGEALRGDHRLTLKGGSYAAFFETLVGAGAVRPKFGRHPRLRILGPLEARLHIADLVVLGGLNEGTWPHRPPPDPWLSRSMQLDMALDDPERRVGLAAHDVAQLLAAPEVLLTRAARVEGAPTVPSRWLSRLDAVLAGAGLLATLEAAGRWISGPEAAGGALARAKRLDDPGAAAPWPRPAPRPPVSVRPRHLRVTDIARLMDDPYRVYARTVLKLSALDALDADPGAAERGEILHDALHMFLRDAPERPALDRLIAAGRHAFSRAGVPPSVAAYWWPRFERLAAWVLEELGRQARLGWRVVATERDGTLVVPAPGGPITIAGRADRIDRAADGSLAIIDYKSGTVPKAKEVQFGYAPQLPLLAAIAEDGRFKDLSASAVGTMAYWRITGGDPPGQVEEREASIEETRMGLARLLAEFDDKDTAYAAAEEPDSEYAHLARVKEWS
jgi:ATP-dependent helicase/nuclease subunit B